MWVENGRVVENGRMGGEWEDRRRMGGWVENGRVGMWLGK